MISCEKKFTLINSQILFALSMFSLLKTSNATFHVYV